MAEIKLNELTPQAISETDNLLGYTEDKEVIIAIPDFAKNGDLQNFISYDGTTTEKPINGNLAIDGDIILKYYAPQPSQILGQDDDGTQYNLLGLRTYAAGTIGELDQVEIGSESAQFNANSLYVPTIEFSSIPDFNTQYNFPITEPKYRIVVDKWVKDNFRQNASIKNVNLSSYPSSVTVNYGVFTVLFQRLSATELVVSIGTTESNPPTVYYLLQYFGPDLTHTEPGEANFTSGSAQIGTYDSTVSKIVSEFNYNNSLFRATFNRYVANYSLCSAYIERIG